MIEKNLYIALSSLSVEVFPLIIPQEKEIPAVTFSRVKTIPTNTLKGMSATNDNGTFRIDVYANDYLTSVETGEEIKDQIKLSFGSDAVFVDKMDEPYDSASGVYHRILLFNLREITEEGGS